MNMATTSFLSPKLEALIKSALAGDTSAQNRLGDLYREGSDVEQNYAEALIGINAQPMLVTQKAKTMSAACT
jgi:NAD(P)H-nitrite reductase large subunit